MSVFHDTTTRLLHKLQKNASASLLLTGQTGTGLFDAALVITSGHTPIIISPDPLAKSRSIAVETIRELYSQTRSKSVGKQFVIIDEADVMSNAAQTAFLKLLEEPAASIHFILLAHQPEQLLPTIRSRAQHHHLQPITSEQSELYLTQLGVADKTKRQQLLFIADGLPEELKKLAEDEQYFRLQVSFMKDARDFLQASSYEKLLIANRYKDRAQAVSLVQSAIAITRRSLRQFPQDKLVKQLDRLLDTQMALESNHNVRLSLAAFVVQ